MYTLDELLKRIELNCKDQFNYHSLWVYARIVLVAFKNDKLDIADKFNKRLYKKVIMDKAIFDNTFTFNMFIHDIDELIREKRKKLET